MTPSNKAHQLHPSCSRDKGAGGLEPKSREQHLSWGVLCTGSGLRSKFSRHVLSLSYPFKGRFPYTNSLGTNEGGSPAISPHSPAIQRASPGTAKTESVLRAGRTPWECEHFPYHPLCVLAPSRVKILRDPVDSSPPSFSVHGFSYKDTRVSYHFFLLGSSQPRMEPVSQTVAGGFLPLSHPGSPIRLWF